MRARVVIQFPTTSRSGFTLDAFRDHGRMSIKSRQSLYGSTIKMSAERAKKVRKEADRLACEAWNYRMLGYTLARTSGRGELYGNGKSRVRKSDRQWQGGGHGRRLG